MKWKMKTYKAWFRIYWDPTMQISSKQQIFYYSNIHPKFANWPPKFIGVHFLPWDQVRAMKWWIKKIVFFSALTLSAKSLGLISVIAPIEMLDLSSTLASTPSVSVGLIPQLKFSHS